MLLKADDVRLLNVVAADVVEVEIGHHDAVVVRVGDEDLVYVVGGAAERLDVLMVNRGDFFEQFKARVVDINDTIVVACDHDGVVGQHAHIGAVHIDCDLFE